MKEDRLPIWATWLISALWVVLCASHVWTSVRYISLPYTFNYPGTLVFVVACVSALFGALAVILVWRFATIAASLKVGATVLIAFVVAANFVTAKVEPLIVNGNDLGHTMVGSVVSGFGMSIWPVLILLFSGKLEALKRPPGAPVQPPKA